MKYYRLDEEKETHWLDHLFGLLGAILFVGCIWFVLWVLSSAGYHALKGIAR